MIQNILILSYIINTAVIMNMFDIVYLIGGHKQQDSWVGVH